MEVPGMDWYDREGNPIDTAEWSRLHEDLDYVRVGLDEVGPYVISTVWLGLDHNYMPNGPLLIFETMVFTKTAWEDRGNRNEDREPLIDLECRRWSTETEAWQGHREIVTLIRATYQEEPPRPPENAENDPK